MTRLDRLHNIADLREAGRRAMPRAIFEFMDRGSEDETALLNNRAAFERIRIRPQVMVDVSDRDLSTTILGGPSALPLAIAPTGAAGLCWHEGEIALARAAARAGVPVALSTTAITSMERIAKAVPDGRLWFQLYMWRDRALSYELVSRARAAGYEALILTVDTPVGPNREYNRRNGFGVPFNPSFATKLGMLRRPGWMRRVLLRYLREGGMPRHENYPAAFQRKINTDPATKLAMRSDSLTWDDIPRLREVWPGRLLIKGILRADDAARAVAAGADAVIVSNHGGRNFDSAVATLDALPGVVAAVGGRATVILDSGVRRGSDILKAVALGATAVMVGRATLYGVMVGGEAGAFHALGLLRDEFDRTMAFAGCRAVADIGPHLLEERFSPPP